jgi:hypothetical protein
MEYYLDHDEFPENKNSNNSERREERRVERRGERVENSVASRRTPTSNRRRNEDTF